MSHTFQTLARSVERRSVTWYALRVQPQAEFKVARALERDGHVVFLPVETVWRGINRYRRTKVRRTYPLLIRYVLIGFSDTGIPWLEIMGYHEVQSVLGVDGTPKSIPTIDIERLALMHHDAPEEHRWMKTKNEFKAGDTATITDGAFEGQLVEVVSVGPGPFALIKMTVFDADQEITISLMRLERA